MVLVVKNLPASAGDVRDPGSIPGWGRSPREGNGDPLQHSCLENSMDRGASAGYRAAESDTTEQVSTQYMNRVEGTVERQWRQPSHCPQGAPQSHLLTFMPLHSPLPNLLLTPEHAKVKKVSSVLLLYRMLASIWLKDSHWPLSP